MMKRLFDILVVSAGLLAVLSPGVLIRVVLIRRRLGSSVFFR